ncbi:MAG TPA: gamma-glutamyl-phosphate reductase, partial [Clostridia bacterium]|nr:gamma-glutamyl-phosphate reductase [Clostridia bacterium]
MTILEQAAQAKAASYSMMNLSSSLKDDALKKMADALEHNADYILEQNEKDLAKGRESGLSDALLDRLRLTKLRISAMAEGLRKIAALPDPLGAEDYV